MNRVRSRGEETVQEGQKSIGTNMQSAWGTENSQSCQEFSEGMSIKVALN